MANEMLPPILTPEEEERLRIAAQVAGSNATLPAPAIGEFEYVEPPAAQREQPTAIQRDMPEPIPFPERQRYRSGTRGSRIAHGVVDALFAPWGGAGYRERLAADEARSDQMYQDDLREYQAALQEQARQNKLKPLPPELLEALSSYGIILPEGSNVAEADLARGFGVGSIVRGREQAAQQMERDKALHRNRWDINEQVYGHRMAEILAKKKRAMAAAGAAGVSGTDPESIYGPDLAPLVYAFISGDRGAEIESVPAAVIAKFGDKVGGKLNSALLRMRSDNVSDMESVSTDVARHSSTTAGARVGVDQWEGYMSKYGRPGVEGAVAELQKHPDGMRLTRNAKEFQRALINMAAQFIASKGGKAITENETNLISGKVAGLLDGTSISGRMADVISSIARKQVASADDVLFFAENVKRELAAGAGAKARGRSGAYELWQSGEKRQAQISVLRAYVAERGSDNPPTVARPVGGSRTNWYVGWPDEGRFEEFRVP